MYKFIIVDDEHLIRKGILKKVEKFDLGLEFVGEAENGDDALELIKKVNPAIVLTDMRMPLMDGRMLLKKLQENFPQIKTIVISGYSDFEYLQEAISSSAVDYILKPFNREEIYKSFTKAINAIDKEVSNSKKIEKIENEIEKANYTSDINYISNLITSSEGIYIPEQLTSRSTMLLKNFSNYVLISVYSAKKSSETIYSELLTYHKSSENFLVIPCSKNLKIGFLLYFYKDQSESHVINYIKNQTETISQYLINLWDCDVFIGVSNIKFDMSFIYSAYLESISALDSRAINSANNIFFTQKSDMKISELNWEHIDTLIFFIESGNIEKVNELLQEFFIAIESLSPLTIKAVKYNYKLLLTNIRNLLESHTNMLNNTTLLNDYENIVNNTFDFTVIKSYFAQFIITITTSFKEKNIYPADQLIENMKNYIEKNYMKNITLEKMSSLFFLNPSYCSFLFKEKTGENLIDYVNKIRIENGKELLKKTNYNNIKIAKILGYSNDKYFFRVFKKITGYSPEKYRHL